MRQLVSRGVTALLVLTAVGVVAQPTEVRFAKASNLEAPAADEADRVSQIDQSTIRQENALQLVQARRRYSPPPPPKPAPPKPAPTPVARPIYRPAPRPAPALIAYVAWRAPIWNHFYYGNCTWYVANRRYVPWFGDAGAWAYSAQAYGFRVGYRPIVGSILVDPPGVDGAWGLGHVAYVEAVYGTTFLVSEMDYGMNGGGFGRVDYRVVALQYGQLFIY